MIVRLAVFAILVLVQTPDQRPAHSTHPLVTPDSMIQMPSNGSEPVLQTLFAIATENHIPMGIVMDGRQSLCKVPLPHNTSAMKVREFTKLVNDTLPAYRISVETGVLNLVPATPPGEVANLLNLKLSEFRASPEPVALVGVDLWMFIRSVIAPNEGTAFTGPSPMNAEKIPSIDIKNLTVQEILNLIVTKESGGVWIIRGAEVKRLSPQLQKPFEIYSYATDQHSLANALSCS